MEEDRFAQNEVYNGIVYFTRQLAEKYYISERDGATLIVNLWHASSSTKRQEQIIEDLLRNCQQRN